MTEVIKLEKINEVFMKVYSDTSIRQELTEYFSFRPPGYQFNPKFKNRVWDGWVRIFNPLKPILYSGLQEYLKKFCDDRDYILEVPENMVPNHNIPDSYVEELAKEIGAKLIPRDYQIQYVLNALRNNRSLSLSPTSSGKSFILYLIQQHYYRTEEAKTLIIVPTVGLVHQMSGDFIDYGCNPSEIFKIQGGIDKNETSSYELRFTDNTSLFLTGADKVKTRIGKKLAYKLVKTLNKTDIILDNDQELTIKNIIKKEPNIFISTWQSLVRQPKEWFDQFSVVLGDEAHLFQAKSLTTIMENLTNAKYRHGFTGTISSESKVHRLILEGVFGPIKRYVTTKQLMDEGTVADFKIKCLVLQHSTDTKTQFKELIKELKKKNPNKTNLVYVSEREFLFANDNRNSFIKNLVHSLKDQNNLILFDLIEKHGKILEPLLRKEGRILHFIYGNTSGEERERIRQEIENDPLKQHDILASYAVFSTGVSIKRLDNIIFASGYKGEIKTLQSIGRGLRKGNGSDKAVLYDITDDLSFGSFTNYTLKHFQQRIDIYGTEEFDFKIYNIDI